MGECELCGAVNVSVRRVQTGKTEVAACGRCVDKLNLAPKGTAPGIARSRNISRAPSKKKKRSDLMNRSSKELVHDFHKRIAKARASRNWNQQQLAKQMAETVNIIKAAESGKRPTDAVIQKFERTLNIVLMEERSADETRFINSGPSRSMTLGDYFDNLR